MIVDKSLRVFVVAGVLLPVGMGAAFAQGWQGPAAAPAYRDAQYRDFQPRDNQYDRGRDDQRRYDDRRGARGGSYLETCSDARQSGPILTAICDDGRGRRLETSIDIGACGRSDIGNRRGVLQCGDVRGSARRVD